MPAENAPVGDRRAEFEAKLAGLRGRVLSAVDYWDVHSYGPEPADWDYGDWHHAVMGVQLGTDQGPVTVTWTAAFFPYGVEVHGVPAGHPHRRRCEWCDCWDPRHRPSATPDFAAVAKQFHDYCRIRAEAILA